MPKRLVDLFFALSLLLLVAPLLLIAALLVKLDSEGPAFFSQWRMGRGFRPFRIYKLRTMAADRRGSAITLGYDPRVTRVGAALRKLHFDELPQLWNVLRGEMSLVGPRPVICALARRYEGHYRRLYAARPGLTDPATLRFADEAVLLARMDNPAEYFHAVMMPRKLRLSRYYQQRATVASDFIVLTRTAVLLGTGLYRCLNQLAFLQSDRQAAAWEG